MGLWATYAPYVWVRFDPFHFALFVRLTKIEADFFNTADGLCTDSGVVSSSSEPYVDSSPTSSKADYLHCPPILKTSEQRIAARNQQQEPSRLHICTHEFASTLLFQAVYLRITANCCSDAPYQLALSHSLSSHVGSSISFFAAWTTVDSRVIYSKCLHQQNKLVECIS